jgi:hypothetical protein
VGVPPGAAAGPLVEPVPPAVQDRLPELPARA